MSKFFSQIHGILENNGESYENKYPEIKNKNVFSISTLAHGSASQVHWKLKGQKGQFPYESNVGKAFFLGRATHEFIQNRMNLVNEYPLEFVADNYKLVGHVDILDFKENHIVELKTTKLEVVELGRLREYMLQAGAYAYLMQKQTGRVWNASIFVINGTLTEYELTQEDIANSWAVIVKRAEECYQKLKSLGQIQIDTSD